MDTGETRWLRPAERNDVVTAFWQETVVVDVGVAVARVTNVNIVCFSACFLDKAEYTQLSSPR